MYLMLKVFYCLYYTQRKKKMKRFPRYQALGSWTLTCQACLEPSSSWLSTLQPSDLSLVLWVFQMPSMLALNLLSLLPGTSAHKYRMPVPFLFSSPHNCSTGGKTFYKGSEHLDSLLHELVCVRFLKDNVNISGNVSFIFIGLYVFFFVNPVKYKFQERRNSFSFSLCYFLGMLHCL